MAAQDGAPAGVHVDVKEECTLVGVHGEDGMRGRP